MVQSAYKPAWRRQTWVGHWVQRHEPGKYAHFRLSLQAIVTGQNRTMRGFGPSKVKVSTS
jgi:hypothetical protein